MDSCLKSNCPSRPFNCQITKLSSRNSKKKTRCHSDFNQNCSIPQQIHNHSFFQTFSLSQSLKHFFIIDLSSLNHLYLQNPNRPEICKLGFALQRLLNFLPFVVLMCESIDRLFGLFFSKDFTETQKENKNSYAQGLTYHDFYATVSDFLIFYSLIMILCIFLLTQQDH